MFEASPLIVKRPRKESGKSTAATFDETLSAAKCQLQPRKAVGHRNQDALKRIGTNGMPVGRPLGVTTGLPISMAICYVFQQNEKAPRNMKLKDARISEWLKSEFPGRPTKLFDKVAEMRAGYNSGRFMRGKPPAVRSHRYDSDGECIDVGFHSRNLGK